jgi:hypothetical protein
MSDSKVNPKECPASIKHLGPPFHILFETRVINSKIKSTMSNETDMAGQSLSNEVSSAR